LQNIPAGSGVIVLNNFEVSKSDLQIEVIGRDLQRALVTTGSGRPVPHKEVIDGGSESDVVVARIERKSAFEAGHCFAPASPPPVNATDESVDVGIIRRSRRGDLELFKKLRRTASPPIERKTLSHMGFAQIWR